MTDTIIYIVTLVWVTTLWVWLITMMLVRLL